jgi:hypothetical protein
MNGKLTRTLAVLVVALGLMVAGAQSGFADRGSIPWGDWDLQNLPEIYEPAQNAIVAWNGKEEILVLTTDLRSSKPTKVLEVLPLPSEPVVTRGDSSVFDKFNALINDELHHSWFVGKGPGGSRSESGQAAEVTFHEKIGAHDISVVHVLDSLNFEQWINDYFQRQGSRPQKISPVLLATIEQYLLDGHHWFVFDVVELGAQLKTNDVIQYRFATDKFYYPMRISATDSGETNINLIAVTGQGLSNYFGLPQEAIRQRHRQLRLDTAKVAAIHPEMGKMFNSESISIQTLRIQGNLKTFDLDVLAR